jgi:hypothetical protein
VERHILVIFVYMTDPMKALKFPMDYVEKVKRVHSVGGYGSQGCACVCLHACILTLLL